ncbi:MAG: acyl carrier protein [Clostridia bacterium]|nr:acyl carrier protein [Clostridia bacterium]MBQ3956039.1 acyl carrier protein [Clostridia bacterium]MBQ5355018.1 acyl carrier protein [Clostridia bacterium]
MTTFEKIRDIIADKSGEDPENITPETEYSSLGIDSLTIVEILMDIEDEFGVTVEAANAGKTVGDLVAKVEEEAK